MCYPPGALPGWRAPGERWIETVISLTFVVSANNLDCIDENLICEPRNTSKMSSWRGKVSRFQIIFSSRNSAKNAGRSSKNAGMWERCQNAGFPARLRDGWHLCYSVEVSRIISSWMVTVAPNGDARTLTGMNELLCLLMVRREEGVRVWPRFSKTAGPRFLKNCADNHCANKIVVIVSQRLTFRAWTISLQSSTMETTSIVNDIVDEIVTCGRVLRPESAAYWSPDLIFSENIRRTTCRSAPT